MELLSHKMEVLELARAYDLMGDIRSTNGWFGKPPTFKKGALPKLLHTRIKQKLIRKKPSEHNQRHAMHSTIAIEILSVTVSEREEVCNPPQMQQ